MALKFFMSVAKWLKLKVRKIWELIFKFVEVTGEKLVGGLFAPPPILNRVKGYTETQNCHGWQEKIVIFKTNLCTPDDSVVCFNKTQKKWKKTERRETKNKYVFSSWRKIELISDIFLHIVKK